MAQMFSLPVLSARLIKYGLHDSAIAEYIFILPCPVFFKTAERYFSVQVVFTVADDAVTCRNSVFQGGTGDNRFKTEPTEYGVIALLRNGEDESFRLFRAHFGQTTVCSPLPLFRRWRCREQRPHRCRCQIFREPIHTAFVYLCQL